jgi:hypothetical protein
MSTGMLSIDPNFGETVSMKRVKVQLKDLKPNPYKKDIQGGFIDPFTVAQIKESASKTSFWEQWVVRKTSNGYELAFGHHRLAAAIELYGPEYEVSVQVEDYSDEQMLIALADENAGREETVEAQVDTIRVARRYLQEHPETCKYLSGTLTDIPKGGDKKHEHGSVRCLLAFLGKDNWNRDKIDSLVSIADRFDAALLRDVVNYDADGHLDRRGGVGITAAVEIAKLEKPAQKVVVRAIKEANKELKTFRETELAERKKNSIPASAVRDMSTYIPATFVREAVKQAATAPKEKQAQEVVKHIKQEVTQRKEYAQVASLPTADSVVSKIVAQLYNFPDDSTMQTLITNRDLLNNLTKKNLLTALKSLEVRIADYRDALVSQPQNKLPSAGQHTDHEFQHMSASGG